MRRANSDTRPRVASLRVTTAACIADLGEVGCQVIAVPVLPV